MTSWKYFSMDMWQILNWAVRANKSDFLFCLSANHKNVHYSARSIDLRELLLLQGLHRGCRGGGGAVTRITGSDKGRLLTEEGTNTTIPYNGKTLPNCWELCTIERLLENDFMWMRHYRNCNGDIGFII